MTKLCRNKLYRLCNVKIAAKEEIWHDFRNMCSILWVRHAAVFYKWLLPFMNINALMYSLITGPLPHVLIDFQIYQDHFPKCCFSFLANGNQKQMDVRACTLKVHVLRAFSTVVQKQVSERHWITTKQTLYATQQHAIKIYYA